MGAMSERLKLAAGKILTKKELALRTSLDMYLTRVHLHVMGYQFVALWPMNRGDGRGYLSRRGCEMHPGSKFAGNLGREMFNAASGETAEYNCVKVYESRSIDHVD